MFSRARAILPSLSPAAAMLVYSASPAQAYIGPGAGLGAIAVTAALGLGIILLLVGLIYYPLKRTLKKNKSDAAADKSHKTSK